MTRKMPVLWIMLIMLILGFMFTMWAQEAMAQTSSLPIYDYLDDGAPLWQGGQYWTHSEAYRFGSSGMGWGSKAGNITQSLLWNRTIDLTNAVKPRLRFASNSDSTGSSMVFIYNSSGGFVDQILVASSSGQWTEVVIDLTPYKGRQIQLSWSPASMSSKGWMIDNVFVEDTFFLTMTPPPNIITITATQPTITPPPNIITITPIDITITPNPNIITVTPTPIQPG